MKSKAASPLSLSFATLLESPESGTPICCIACEENRVDSSSAMGETEATEAATTRESLIQKGLQYII
eukprot:15187146-Heterocapsa_arctica.AAC.1